MKYLKLFENHTAYEEARQNLILPNVSLCVQENEVHYNPIIPPYQGFCKLTLEDGSIVEIEGSGELTSAMTQTYCSTCVSVEIGNACTSIGNKAFYKSVGGFYKISGVTIGNNVTSIGSSAFEDCGALTSINIPSNVTSIGDYAFYGCYFLTGMTVDSNNSVYDSRNNCNAIIETATNTLLFGCNDSTIPNGITSINEYAFYDMEYLENITIPNTVTSIGERAFEDCGLISVTIGSGITSIGYYAFGGCYSLISITLLATTPPTLGNIVFEYPNSYPIYVPAASVEAYKAASGWSDYASRIQAIP